MILQCKKCSKQIFESYAEEDHGDLIINCSYCGAKNVVAPKIINRIGLWNWFEVVGYRD